jgi:hypothetical protein
VERSGDLDVPVIRETAKQIIRVMYDKGGMESEGGTKPHVVIRRTGSRFVLCFHGLLRVIRSMLNHAEWTHLNPMQKRCVVSAVYDATERPGVLVVTLSPDERKRAVRRAATGEVRCESTAGEALWSSPWIRSRCGGWTHALSPMTIVAYDPARDGRKIVGIPIFDEDKVIEVNGLIQVATFLAVHILSGCTERGDGVGCEVRIRAAANQQQPKMGSMPPPPVPQSANGSTECCSAPGLFYVIVVHGAKKFGARSLGTEDMWMPMVPDVIKECLSIKYDCPSGCHMLRVDGGEKYTMLASFIRSICAPLVISASTSTTTAAAAPQDVHRIRFGFEVPCLCGDLDQSRYKETGDKDATAQKTRKRYRNGDDEDVGNDRKKRAT